MQKIKPTKDGFWKVDDRLPIEYDLCLLVGKNGKTAMGWRTSGISYDGTKIDKIDKVIAWKKTKEM